MSINVIATEYARNRQLTHTAVSLYEPGPHGEKAQLICQVPAGEDVCRAVLDALDVSSVEFVRCERVDLR